MLWSVTVLIEIYFKQNQLRALEFSNILLMKGFHNYNNVNCINTVNPGVKRSIYI